MLALRLSGGLFYAYLQGASQWPQAFPLTRIHRLDLFPCLLVHGVQRVMLPQTMNVVVPLACKQSGHSVLVITTPRL